MIWWPSRFSPAVATPLENSLAHALLPIVVLTDTRNREHTQTSTEYSFTGLSQDTGDGGFALTQGFHLCTPSYMQALSAIDDTLYAHSLFQGI